MKKTIKLFGLILSMFFINISYTQAQASFELQCKGHKDGHFISLQGEEIEKDSKYSYIFSNLTTYKLKVIDTKNPKSKISVKIYRVEKDETEKEVASNEKNGKYFHTFTFKCGEAGRYHIKFDKISNN